MDKAATKDERKDALMRAEQQGLDIQLVAKLVTSDAVKTAKVSSMWETAFALDWLTVYDLTSVPSTRRFAESYRESYVCCRPKQKRSRYGASFGMDHFHASELSGCACSSECFPESFLV